MVAVFVLKPKKITYFFKQVSCLKKQSCPLAFLGTPVESHVTTILHTNKYTNPKTFLLPTELTGRKRSKLFYFNLFFLFIKPRKSNNSQLNECVYKCLLERRLLSNVIARNISMGLIKFYLLITQGDANVSMKFLIKGLRIFFNNKIRMLKIVTVFLLLVKSAAWR